MAVIALSDLILVAMTLLWVAIVYDKVIAPYFGRKDKP